MITFTKRLFSTLLNCGGQNDD